MQELKNRGELPATREGLAIELALRVGDMMASSGASAKDTVVMMRKICNAYGLSRAQLDVTANVIMAAYYPGEGLPPFTAIRNVSPAVANLSKVYAMNDLVQQIGSGLSISKATKRFDRIRKDNEPFPGWLAGLAGGGISMSVQLFYTTSIKMLILALITGFLVNRFVYLLKRVGLPTLFQQIFGGWLVVAIAAGFTWLNLHPKFAVIGYVSPTTLAVGCVFQLVVGGRFVAGVQDAIDGFYVTATSRIFEVVLMTAGLVVGLISGLDLARRIGVGVYISAEAPTVGAAPIAFIAATLTAVFFALSQYANLRIVLVTAGVTFLARVIYWLAMLMGMNQIVATFAGPMVAALVVAILVRRYWKLPAFGIINAMGIPFVPGLMLYLGLLQLVGSHSIDPDPSKGATTLGMAVAIGLAVAAGASLGVFFGRPVSEKLMLMPRAWNQLLKKTPPIPTPAGGKLAHVNGRKRSSGIKPIGEVKHVEKLHPETVITEPKADDEASQHSIP